LTSFVVVGENAGESKLKRVAALNVEQISEDEFLGLIATRKGAKLDDKQKAIIAKEEKKIAETAAAMVKQEKEEEKLRKRKEAALEGTGVASKCVVNFSNDTHDAHVKQEDHATDEPALDHKVCADESQRHLRK
jgi:replication factor C subunit 1